MGRLLETLRGVVGTIGEQIIYLLMFLFGARVRDREVEWLAGPHGGAMIGDRPYEETAEREGLSLERDSAGGLIPDFAALASDRFEPGAVSPRIREFYESTAHHRFDTWATTYFPTRIALWLLVTTISRRVNQLNFPLDGLEMARGIRSEVALLRRPDGSVRYAGWYRTLRSTGRSLFTGFYMTEQVPKEVGPCLKVIFPMPNGNATVVLRPENTANGGLRLVSNGRAMGETGFYRIGRIDDETLRVWRIQSLHERFELYEDKDGVLWCDHRIRFLGLPCLALHYRIERTTSPSAEFE